jgi:hypothetical protein
MEQDARRIQSVTQYQYVLDHVHETVDVAYINDVLVFFFSKLPASQGDMNHEVEINHGNLHICAYVHSLQNQTLNDEEEVLSSNVGHRMMQRCV